MKNKFIFININLTKMAFQNDPTKGSFLYTFFIDSDSESDSESEDDDYFFKYGTNVPYPMGIYEKLEKTLFIQIDDPQEIQEKLPSFLEFMYTLSDNFNLISLAELLDTDPVNLNAYNQVMDLKSGIIFEQENDSQNKLPKPFKPMDGFNIFSISHKEIKNILDREFYRRFLIPSDSLGSKIFIFLDLEGTYEQWVSLAWILLNGVSIRLDPDLEYELEENGFLHYSPFAFVLNQNPIEFSFI